MEKIINLAKTLPKIKLICWDLDGTLLDTEKMWHNMDKLVKETGKKSEEIAAEAYKTWGYRAHAEIALKHFKEENIKQVIINRCDLTNKTIIKNETLNQAFPITQFDAIIGEDSFEKDFTNEDMYQKTTDDLKINTKSAVAICDMPFELKAAKNSGIITIWAKNKDYPFTSDELKEIETIADYYVEDFADLI